ncbi:Mediator of RNA polymerase II transcription subunit 8 [Chlorella vulgaris]
MLRRSDALDRFAVINVQYQHLLDALRPLLRQFAAYPRSVNQTNAPILPIMLATKLLPEMEEQERDLLAQQEGEQQALAPVGAHRAAAPSHLSLAEQFAWVQDQEQELNHLIDRLAREEGSPLGEKRRKEVAAAAAKAAAAPPAGARPPLLPAVRQVLPGAQQQRRSGPADPLLAAVTFGAGL